jgi:hypothetical protein
MKKKFDNLDNRMISSLLLIAGIVYVLGHEVDKHGSFEGGYLNIDKELDYPSRPWSNVKSFLSVIHTFL